MVVVVIWLYSVCSFGKFLWFCTVYLCVWCALVDANLWMKWNGKSEKMPKWQNHRIVSGKLYEIVTCKRYCCCAFCDIDACGVLISFDTLSISDPNSRRYSWQKFSVCFCFCSFRERERDDAFTQCSTETPNGRCVLIFGNSNLNLD